MANFAFQCGFEYIQTMELASLPFSAKSTIREMPASSARNPHYGFGYWNQRPTRPRPPRSWSPYSTLESHLRSSSLLGPTAVADVGDIIEDDVKRMVNDSSTHLTNSIMIQPTARHATSRSTAHIGFFDVQGIGAASASALRSSFIGYFGTAIFPIFREIRQPCWRR